MRVLHLMVFERILGRGVIRNQVLNLLAQIKARHHQDIQIIFMAVLPLAVISRSGITIPAYHHREALRKLSQELSALGIQAQFYYVPMAKLLKTALYLNVFSLFLLIVLAFPIILYQIRRQDVQVIHCRSYLPTLCALTARFFARNVRVLCDPRGFYPDEGVSSGRWSITSWTYRVWKQLEKRMFFASDHVIALSEGFKREVELVSGTDQCTVVYASVDTSKYEDIIEQKHRLKQDFGFENNIIFTYNGSIGVWHDPSTLARLFSFIRKDIPHSKLLMLTPYSKDRLGSIFASFGLTAEDFLILHCPPHQVPNYLVASDFGMVPLRNTDGDPAMQVTAQTMIGTKVAEYLAAGLPLVVNREVKGLEGLMSRFSIGTWYDNERPTDTVKNISTILNEYSKYQTGCVEIAKGLFDMQKTADIYFDLYSQVLARQTPVA